MNNKSEKLIFLEPVFKEMIWGGNKLRSNFGYDIPGDKTGECWAVSAHENGDCIVKDGAYKGIALSKLYREHRELFGNYKADKFPLLTKIIDAKQDLSIQVHPDDEYANKFENGSLGKTECWYILDCEESSTIIVGHNAKNKEELVSMIDNNEWDKLIREIPIKKGDFFQINPGTVHAIKGGTVILETQQSSDVTYRLYDYGRLSNGVPRELHLDKSKDVIICPYTEENENYPKVLGEGITNLYCCQYYTVNKYDIAGEMEIDIDSPFTIMSVIEGNGIIDGREVKKGDNFIIPSGYGKILLSGSLSLIASWV